MGTWASGPQFDWQLGTVQLTEYDDNGFLGLQIDSLGDQGGMDPLDAVHPFGFEGRPNDPEDDATGNLTLYTFEGDEGYAIALGDYRLVSKLPELKKGGSRMYCATGSYIVADGEDGTVTIYVPTDANNTKAHEIQIGVDANGKRILNLVHADGYGITMTEDQGIILSAGPNTRVEILPDAINFVGKVNGAGNMSVGGAGALPVLVGTAASPISSTTLFAM